MPAQNAECIVIGDLHGDLDSLNNILLRTNFEDKAKSKDNIYLVFMGDYVDRGLRSIETLNRVLELKIKFPEQVIVLRGNHDNVDLIKRSLNDEDIPPMPSDIKSQGCSEKQWAGYWENWNEIPIDHPEDYEEDRNERKFPQDLRHRFGEKEGMKLFRLFKKMCLALPSVIFTGNHYMIGHGAVPHGEGTLQNGIQELLGPDRDIVQEQLRCNHVAIDDNITDDILHLRFANPYLREVSQQRVVKVLDAYGVSVFIHGHDEFVSPYVLMGNGRIVTIISADGKSADASKHITWQGRYGIFSLQNDAKAFDRDTLSQVIRILNQDEKEFKALSFPPPDNIKALFIDDRKECVERARSFGMNAVVCRSDSALGEEVCKVIMTSSISSAIKSVHGLPKRCVIFKDELSDEFVDALTYFKNKNDDVVLWLEKPEDVSQIQIDKLKTNNIYIEPAYTKEIYDMEVTVADVVKKMSGSIKDISVIAPEDVLEEVSGAFDPEARPVMFLPCDENGKYSKKAEIGMLLAAMLPVSEIEKRFGAILEVVVTDSGLKVYKYKFDAYKGFDITGTVARAIIEAIGRMRERERFKVAA